MKILMISNIFPPGFMGGYELRAFETARALQQKGNEVRVLTSDYFLDYEKSIKDFTVDRILEYVAYQHCYTADEALEQGQFVNVRNLRLFNQVFNEFKPDVVVCFNLFGLGVLGILHHLVSLKVKPIISLGDNIFNALKGNAEILKKYLSIFGSLDFLQHIKYHLVSRALSCEIEKFLGFPFKDSHVIPAWSKQRKSKTIIAHLRDTNPLQTTRFVFISGLTFEKGIYILIEAVHHLVASGISDFIVDLYGMGKVSVVIQQIAIKGLASFIQYRNVLSRDCIHETFLHYDALLFPTWEREPFGLVVLEAASAGCIPLMTGTIGAAEWFIHDYDCIKMERNYLSLSSAMNEFIHKGKQDKELIKLRTMNTASTYLNFENSLNSFYQLIIDTAQSNQKELQNTKRCEMAMGILEHIWRKG